MAKDYKNEVSFLKTEFNTAIIEEKNNQLQIYKEVLDKINKKS